MEKRIDKTLAVYKGDLIAGLLMGGIGVLCFVTSVLLYYLSAKIGYYYLSVGLFLFALYGIGKGIAIMFVAKNRLNHYRSMTQLDAKGLNDEKVYTEYRLNKKEKSRRMYAWIFGIAIVTAFCGIFIGEKGLTVGTGIPIILFSAIEFVYGLLTEFRLWEYKRYLDK